MKYHIYWQNQHGIWQKFLTKTNEADTYRTMKRRTDERTEYKKRSFKEKQAVQSMALEFMQKRSGQ